MLLISYVGSIKANRCVYIFFILLFHLISLRYKLPHFFSNESNIAVMSYRNIPFKSHIFKDKFCNTFSFSLYIYVILHQTYEKKFRMQLFILLKT